MRRTIISTMMMTPCLFLLVITHAYAQTSPLPSWNDGTAKQSVIDFVKRVTTKGGKDFVPAAERIAVFDNDGTLVGRATHVLSARFRSRPREGACAAASRNGRTRSRSSRSSKAT